MFTTIARPLARAPHSGVDRTDVEMRLLQCFDDSTAGDPRQMSLLRRAAGDYAHSIREQGLPPEQLVIALKKVLSWHGDCATLPSLLEEQLKTREPFAPSKYACVLRWCIESYYE